MHDCAWSVTPPVLGPHVFEEAREDIADELGQLGTFVQAGWKSLISFCCSRITRVDENLAPSEDRGPMDLVLFTCL